MSLIEEIKNQYNETKYKALAATNLVVKLKLQLENAELAKELLLRNLDMLEQDMKIIWEEEKYLESRYREPEKMGDM